MSENQDHPEEEVSGDTVRDIPEARAITRARVKDVRDLLAKYIRRHVPAPPKEPDSVLPMPKRTGNYGALIIVLQVIPWALASLFLFSFFWDFDGVILRPFGLELALGGLIRILSVSGLIGFFTNWLAITMLFNPREKRPIFGQGLIPSQRERVVYRLATAVSEELINEEIIKQKIEEAEIIPKYREMALSVTRGILEDPDFRNDLKGITTDYVGTVLASEQVRRRIVEFTIEKLESYLGEGMGGLALKAYRYLNEDDFKRRIDRAITEIPASLDGVLDGVDDLLDEIPSRIEARSEDIEVWATRIVLGFVENLDVQSMIMSNIARYDERQLEDLLKKTTNEQLNYIKYLGGVLGCIGGLVIWQPILSIAFLGTVSISLYGLDSALFAIMKRNTEADEQIEPSKVAAAGVLGEASEADSVNAQADLVDETVESQGPASGV